MHIPKVDHVELNNTPGWSGIVGSSPTLYGPTLVGHHPNKCLLCETRTCSFAGQSHQSFYNISTNLTSFEVGKDLANTYPKAKDA
jgi:hypothetical protein